MRILNQKGSILIPFIIIMPFLIILTTTYLELSTSSFRTARNDLMRTKAQLTTDAGLDLALSELSANPSWSGSGGEQLFHNDGQIRTTYEVNVVTAGDTKTVTSIGRTYRSPATTIANNTVKVEVTLRGIETSTYSLVTGVGGLYMSNNAKIVGGDVIVNGEINLQNSSQIGLTTNSVMVDVAHQICPVPADATYPRICNNGENGQPINISGSAHIYGTVRANNQVDGARMSNPGLTASSGVPAQPLPVHDRDAQKATIAQEQTGAWASCSSNIVRTWPANLKINGNVTISGLCQIIIEGNIWITGSLTLSNSAQLTVSNSLGSTRPDVMVDGDQIRMNQSSIIRSNSTGTGARIITYRSNAACSPDCANLSGADLYNSRNLITIEFNNSSSGPNTIFYARWSKVQMNNGGQVGALIGQVVDLRNSGTITFGTSTSLPGTVQWVVSGYRRVY